MHFELLFFFLPTWQTLCAAAVLRCCTARNFTYTLFSLSFTYNTETLSRKAKLTMKWRGSRSRLRYNRAALFPRFRWKWIPKTGKPVFLCCHNILPLRIWLIVFSLLKHCYRVLSNNIEKSFIENTLQRFNLMYDANKACHVVICVICSGSTGTEWTGLKSLKPFLSWDNNS